MSKNKFLVFLEMIKFEHTIFALPFAYLGAFMAVGGLPPVDKLFWITVAMVGARTAAMALNRLIDRHIDKLNPRTAQRAIPSGAISTIEVWAYTIISFAVLFLAATMLNPLCVKLMPIAVFVLVIYSYMKRISWTCHIVLGIAIGLAPLGSWVAITGKINLPGVILAIAVASWVAGFDIIYSCQDWEFDKENKLHSIPVEFGLEKALIISKLFHIIAPAMFVIIGLIMNFGIIYYVGVLIAISLLLYEHSLVRPNDLTKIDMAFFNMNGYLSVVMFVFTLIDLIIK
ncbi:4-hydroxybenzoate polyprenyltransferase [Desulfitispora alkaliphila]|uniref:UbiA-like polyprenyltransferase n=1 Tax=Desulfitispora alkaliphila TaxID=622674 RepID=UPI003D1DF378